MPGRSRYDGLPTASLLVEDGAGGTREVSYLLPRTPLSPDQATVNMILGIGYVIDEVESPATRSAREASFLQARILIG